MAVKTYKPTTPSRRNMTTPSFAEITKKTPEKSLLAVLKKNSGRNNTGRITVRHHGGGNKKKYRIIDFKRAYSEGANKVIGIEYDPNRTAYIMLLEDENGKTNLDLHSVGGALLLISQFTLYANCKKGNRPSFVEAAKPEKANELYEYIIEECKKQVEVVERGEFGADMKVELLNDGPFTIVLDSDEL